MLPVAGRLHTTILPVKVPGGAGLLQSMSLYGAAEASTTGTDDVTPAVIEEPCSVAVAPPVPALRLIVDWKVRCWVEAATVVTHGPPWSAVPAPGPAFPAEAETKIPAAYASRKASSTGSLYGSAPPEMEKLITRTLSRIARWIASTVSELKQPWMPQIL